MHKFNHYGSLGRDSRIARARKPRRDNGLIICSAKVVPDLKRVPSVVVIQNQNGPMPAFWQAQYSWNNDHYISRLGHQYLSVHYVYQQKEKYQKYEESLEPQVSRFLDIWRSTVSSDRAGLPLDRIGFGYINTFEAPSVGLDLSEYFKLQLGFNIDVPDLGLSGLRTNFNLTDQSTNTHLLLELSVEESPISPGKVKLVTKVYAERLKLENLSFDSINENLSTVKSIKSVAKDAFFGFATDNTHQLMGAQYV